MPRDADSSTYRGLDAEVCAIDGTTNPVTVYRMIVAPGTAPARLHTGNGIGDGIHPSDSIRIIGLVGDRSVAGSRDESRDINR